MACDPEGRGPKSTCLATSANARFPSKPLVFSGAGVSSSGICAGGLDPALTSGAPVAVQDSLDLQPANAKISSAAQTSSGRRLTDLFFIQAFPAASAASCRFFFRTATAETAIPIK